MALNEAANGPLLYSERPQSKDKFQKILDKNKRTFIVPTAFGAAFGAMSLVLFFMATGYANNLIFIFFFMLISIALTGMMITNRNAKSLEFLDFRIDSVFAQEQALLSVKLKNVTNIASWDFQVFFEKLKLEPTLVSIPCLAEISADVLYYQQKRGRVKLPRLIVQSSFPFGLLRAWRYFRSGSEHIIVFPARIGNKDFPQSLLEGSKSHNSGSFRDHRIYQAGDSVRRIDWKASARRREVLVKNYEEPEKPTLNFSWEQTENLIHFETRLSQLTVWIDQAEQKHYIYSLKLGSQTLGPAQGKEHFQKCLEKLALANEETLR